MQETENIDTIEEEIPEQIDPIQVICQGQCPSLSGRSTLTFEIGQDPEDSSLHLRISDNSGGGMWCRSWARGDDIDSLVIGQRELTSKTFNQLHEGKSINTGGFISAVLNALGLIQPAPENSRHQIHAEGSSFSSVVAAYMERPQEEPEPKKPTRKKGRAD